MNYHKVEIVQDTPAEDIIKIDESKLMDVQKTAGGHFRINGLTGLLTVRTLRTFKYKGFFLSSDVNWVITKDEAGTLVLVPYKKD